jgi:hypothetical protein
MGSLQLNLASEKKLHWPKSCAVCGAKAGAMAHTSISTPKNFKYYGVLLKWTENTLSVSFPVCRKHRIFCSVLDLPAKLGLINALLFMVFSPTILWISSSLLISWLASLTGLKGSAFVGSFVSVSGFFFYGSTVLLYLLAATIKPVRLSQADGNAVTLSVRNEDYFKSLQGLNPPDCIYL